MLGQAQSPVAFSPTHCWAYWEESGASLSPRETMKVSILELGALRTWRQTLENTHPSSKRPTLTVPQALHNHSFIQQSFDAKH